jgi:hypothetical protein
MPFIETPVSLPRSCMRRRLPSMRARAASLIAPMFSSAMPITTSVRVTS